MFGTNVGATVVAEGIETPAELDAVASTGIRVAQGFYLGRPMPLDAAIAAAATAPQLTSKL
jgi:EAL domain-containing protein (putative c-di-GMP-specific phosphodiesterase class I)